MLYLYTTCLGVWSLVTALFTFVQVNLNPKDNKFDIKRLDYICEMRCINMSREVRRDFFDKLQDTINSWIWLNQFLIILHNYESIHEFYSEKEYWLYITWYILKELTYKQT